MGRPISRRKILGMGIAGATAVALGKLISTDKTKRPNILFIMADDMPPGDLSCYSNQKYRTPNIDKLAHEGMRFTNAYAAAPNCQPTRCAFMTGGYPQKFTIGNKGSADEASEAIPDINLASVLESAGYENALVGKWNLGKRASASPLRKGFHEFFGIRGSNADYFEHKNAAKATVLVEGFEKLEREGYLTDLFTDRAIEFVSRAREKPFFLSLNYTAPHSPIQGPEDGELSKALWDNADKVSDLEFSEKFERFGSRQSYVETIKRLDDCIGRVMNVLREKNLERDTLVIFTSDNGGVGRFGNMHPFKGGKATTWEGGIRVPTIISWPGKISAGQVLDWPIITMDLTATILAVAQTSDSQMILDGTSILNGKEIFSNRNLFWRWRTYRSVRSGKWKYLQFSDQNHLFDLEVDASESTNLAQLYPVRVNELKAALKNWESELLPAPDPDDPSFLTLADTLRLEKNKSPRVR